MKTCSNCGSTKDPLLVLSQGSMVISAICDDCADGAKIIKLILLRDPDGIFSQVQYTVIEMLKKAFGK